MRKEVAMIGNKIFAKGHSLLFVFSVMIVLIGCRAKRNNTPNFIGHYVMDTKYGRCELNLAENDVMYESIFPNKGDPKAIKGTWNKTKNGVLLTPFLRFEPIADGTPRTYFNSELTTDADFYGNSQLVLSDDFGWWFKRG